MTVDLPIRLSSDERRALLDIARGSLTSHLETGRVPAFRTDSPALREPRASFVTLRVRDTGKLRGCRGERLARQPLIESVARMVIAAAIDDPRFDPVTASEAPHVTIEISALGPMHPIRPDEIELGRHGLVLAQGRRLALLLPSVPTAFGWGLDEYLAALCDKADLPATAWRSADAALYGFETESWAESAD